MLVILINVCVVSGIISGVIVIIIVVISLVIIFKVNSYQGQVSVYCECTIVCIFFYR